MTVIFTTRKLRTCLPSPKANSDSNLKSHVIYKSVVVDAFHIFVQTWRPVTTGTNRLWLYDNTSVARYQKFFFIEALHINRRKPQLNTWDKYKSRELTLKNVVKACSAQKFLM